MAAVKEKNICHGLRFSYMLEWSDIVVDIREQFPLFNRELAIEIAQEKGIKYPVFKGTDIPYIMTTDFMITIRTGTEKWVIYLII